jgi:hypothetical protein
MVNQVSTRGVAVFADYQLLAAMGKLLEYLKAPTPIEAEPLPQYPIGIFPTKLPPVMLHAPGPGPEPLSTFEPMPKTGDTWPMPVVAPKKSVSSIQDLWPKQTQVADKAEQPVKDQAKTASAQVPGGHFPFASAGETVATGDTWPATALSFSPAAANLR